VRETPNESEEGTGIVVFMGQEQAGSILGFEPKKSKILI